MEYWVVLVSEGEAVTVQKCRYRAEALEWIEKLSRTGLGEYYIQEVEEQEPDI